MSFSWTSSQVDDDDDDDDSSLLNSVDLVSAENGEVFWNDLIRSERLTWALTLPPTPSSNAKKVVNLGVKAELRECQQSINPCECSYFGVYQVETSGLLKDLGT